MHSCHCPVRVSPGVLSIGLAVALAVAGCRDIGTEATGAPTLGPAFARTSSALTALGPGWRTDAAEPYACLATIATKSGPIPHLYRRVPLRLPPGLEARDGAVAALRYQAVRSDGSVTAVLNCVIPATSRAREAVARRFGIPLTPEVNGVIMAVGERCVIDQLNGKTNDCPIAPIVVRPQPVDNPCNYSDYCIPGVGDPTGGGGYGGGTTPGGGSTGGGSTPCSNCGPNSPALSCGGEVQRGAPVSCVLSGSGDLDVVSWSFSDGTSSVTAPGGRADWSGPAVASGTAFVSLVNGTTLYASVTVKARGWTWASNGVSEYRDGTGAPCLNHTPTFGSPGALPHERANGINLEIGWTDCDTGRRFIQPDSWVTGDGFTVATAPSGPNQGMHYVSSATLYMRRESTYNAGMFPTAPLVVIANAYALLACDSVTNWYRFSTCMHANPDAYIAGAKAHEGRGTTGHNGHFSAAYDAAADTANDPMKLLDEQVGANSETQTFFLNNVRDAFRRAAKRVDDATADVSFGGTIVTGNWAGTYYGWTVDHFAPTNTTT